MNYHEARQRADGAGWAWTTMNDDRVWTSGGCRVVTGDTRSDVEVLNGAPMPESATIALHAHETREEAERCFYDHEVQKLREHSLGDDEQHRCDWIAEDGERCTNWTNKWLEGHLIGHLTFLCDEHRDAAHWQQVNPFVPGIRITASW